MADVDSALGHLNTDPPAILYQYMNEGAADVLRSRRILTSAPNSLNDPFEWNPLVEENLTPTQVRATLERLREGAPLPRPAPTVIADIMKHRIEIARGFQEQFCNDFGDRQGLLCFSRTEKGILMWAHYAQKHLGFVVGFKSAELVTGKPDHLFLEVEYDDNRPIVPHLYNRSADDRELFPAFARKSREWTYEEEWRLIIARSHMQDGFDGMGRPARFLHFSGAAIESVIFGSRASDKLKYSLRDACAADQELRGVKFFQVRLHRTRFEIEIDSA